MTTLATFTTRLSYRLVTIKNNNFGPRKSADQINYVINNEVEIIEEYNKKHGLSINEGALHFLAYQDGNVPKTTIKQKAWLKSTILRLNDIKEQK